MRSRRVLLSGQSAAIISLAVAALFPAAGLRADTTATFEQNANGQAYSDTFFNSGDSGPTHTDSGNYPNNNNWSQSYTTATDGFGDVYETAPSNWNTQTYPNDPSIDVDIPGLTVALNVNATVGNLEIDSPGAIDILDNNTLTIDGSTITDNGTIVVNSNQVSVAAILDFGGGTVSGTGTILLNYASNLAQLNGTLTQSAGHTIQGEGQINAALNNFGIVNATVNGASLTLQTSAMTNNNIFEASTNANLAISGITVTQGTGGQIAANGASSIVTFTGGTTITGGTLTTSAGGVIRISNGTNTIDNVTNSGTLTLLDNTTLNVADNLVDNGTITVNSNQASAATVLSFGGGTLSGTGTILLNYPSNLAQLNGTLTQSAGHTIQGEGEINAALTNYGTVNANVSAQTLTLQTSAMTNNNIFEATNNAELAISGIIVTQGNLGQISASGAGSLVALTGGTTISGGTLATSSSGLIRNSSGTNTIDNVTNASTLNVISGSTLNVADNLIDDGTITVNSNQSSAATVLNFTGGTLSGSGTITLNYASNLAQLNGTLIQSAGHLIQGEGQINAALTNYGTVNADTNDQTLTLQTSAMTNNNIFQATNNAELTISGITVTQGSLGQISASGAGSVVSLSSGATISGGTLNSSSAGVFQISGTDTLDSLTNNAVVNIPNGNTLEITGNLTDNGTITVNSNQASSTSILSFNGGTLSGTGTVTLHMNIYALLNGTLTQSSGHFIQGLGQINATLTNQGTVDANVNGQALNISSPSITNTGLMEATAGGTLVFNNGVAVNNAGGQIIANGGNIDLNNATSITGGTLTAVSPNVFSVGGYNSTLGYSANLNGVTLAAGTEMDLPNGNVLSITGPTLTNNGLIVINNNQSSSAASLTFNSNTLLTGTGIVKLNYSGAYSQINTGSGDTLTQDINHTIEGEGQINASLINFGVVNANVNGQALTLETNAMTNNIVFEATNGGTLAINGITVTQAYIGQIFAATASAVSLSSGTAISGGTLNSSGTGAFQISGTDTFDSLTSNAAVNIPNGNTLDITGNLTDNGTIVVNSNQASSSAILNFNGGTVSGTGTIQLNYPSTLAQLNGVLTQSAGHTIQGEGQINAALTNYGTVNANVNGQTLTLQSSAMANNSIFEATSSGTMTINGIIVTQGASGQISAATASAVTLSSGAAISGGTLNSSGTGFFQISGTDTFGSLTNNAAVNIPDGNTLDITGNLTDNGTIVVNSNLASAPSILSFNGGTLSGTGTIVLDYVSIYALLNGALTQSAGHTIQGFGEINATLTNQGTVNANVNAQALLVNGTTTNTGLMRASNHGTLQFATGVLTNLSGTTLTGGSYEVDANSTIVLPGTVVTNAANITLGGAGYTFAAIAPLAVNSGSFTVTNGASFTRTGTFNNSGKVTVGSAAMLHITSALTNTGLVDLTGGTLQLDQGVASSTILSQINAAYDHGAWDGTSGITSSLAEADTHHATAVGYTGGGGSYTLMYTWIGDTNLDGLVNNTDLLAMAPVGTINATWAKGDFNYDGVVNADDYALFMLGSVYAGSANISATLPEPANLLLMAGLSMAGFRPRRRLWQ